MDAKVGNLEFIEGRFRKKTARALENYRLKIPDLSHLLRKVTTFATDTETKHRDSFDDLLSMYSLVEIGCLVGAMPDPLPDDFAVNAKARLGRGPVVTYYEKNYPLLLPSSLRWRLSNRHSLREEKLEGAVPAYLAYLDLILSIDDDQEVNLFLWMLDGGRANGDEKRWPDLLRVLGSEELFEEQMTRPPARNRDWNGLRIDDALRGMGTYLEHCVALERLFDRRSDFPLLMSAIWHFDGYWFDRIDARIGDKLVEAIRLFGEWKPEGVSDWKFKQSRKEVNGMIKCIESVFDRARGEPLREALAEEGLQVGEP